MAYKIEVERADGVVFYVGGGEHKLFENAEDADWEAEQFWLKLAHTEEYARFSVIDAETGDTYTDWEV